MNGPPVPSLAPKGGMEDSIKQSINQSLNNLYWHKEDSINTLNIVLVFGVFGDVKECFLIDVATLSIVTSLHLSGILLEPIMAYVYSGHWDVLKTVMSSSRSSPESRSCHCCATLF